MNARSASVIIAYALAIMYTLISLLLSIVEAKRSFWPKQNIHEDKWLNLWANTSIILFEICMILALLHKTPNICTKTYWMGSIFWIAANYTLTMFQTRRLQYTFHTQFKSTSVESLGYPNKIFYVIYGAGTLLLLICIFYFPHYAYGHLDHGSVGCQITFQSGFFATTGTLLALLFAWDWTVLGLYIHGVRELRKVIKNGLNDDNALKASYIVRKILFLTVFFEISTVINVALFSFSDHPSVSTAMHLNDTMLSVIIVFLMRQHNDDWYRKLSCICCCLSKVLLIEKTKHLIRYHSVSPREVDEEKDNGKFVFGPNKEVRIPLSGVISVDEDQKSNNNTSSSNKSSKSSRSSKSKPSTTSSSSTTKTNTESTKSSSDPTGETVSFEYPPFNRCDTNELLGLSERNFNLKK